MSARRQYKRQHPRRITVRGVRLGQPDLHKLGRVLIALAEAEAEKEARERAGSDREPSVAEPSEARPEQPDA